MPDGGRIKQKVGALDLEYVRKGKGKPVVLLHGGDGPVDSAPFAEKLAEKFDVIVPVHPGFGGTPIPHHFDNVRDLILAHFDFLEDLNLRDVALVGFGLGGWVAAELATTQRERIGKLVLVDAVGIKPGGVFDRDIADVFGLAQAEITRRSWHDPKKPPDIAAMSDDQLARLAAERTAHAAYVWEPYMHNPKLKHRLYRIKAPTLIVWGESDGIVTTKYGEAYAKLIPGAQLKVIAKAGHLPHLEQPDEFVRTVVPFIS